MKQINLKKELDKIYNNRFDVELSIGIIWLCDYKNKIRYRFINANQAYNFAYTMLEAERNYKLNN